MTDRGAVPAGVRCVGCGTRFDAGALVGPGRRVTCPMCREAIVVGAVVREQHRVRRTGAVPAPTDEASYRAHLSRRGRLRVVRWSLVALAALLLLAVGLALADPALRWFRSV